MSAKSSDVAMGYASRLSSRLQNAAKEVEAGIDIFEDVKWYLHSFVHKYVIT